tara:strand:+ start:110 stop:382 length:273 start_codon:yes stop_codon:yes gene_type:complete
MEYNHKLVEALSKISISPLLIGDPNSLRILLEDKLDEAHHHTLDINIKGLSEDITITRGELSYLSKVREAYNLFMYLYQDYLDNKSIINK